MKKNLLQPKHYLSSKSFSKDKKIICPNCSQIHSGNFCPNCGQSVELINKPFKEIFSDLLGSLSAFDYRLWRSVALMFAKPGKLSECYLQGKRAYYTPPFKLFVFISFLFFFLVNLISPKDFSNSIFESNINIGDTLTSFDQLDSFIKSNLNDSIYIIKDETASADNLINRIGDASGEKQSKSLLNFSENNLNEIMKSDESKKLFYNRINKFLSWALFLLMPIFALFLKILYIRQKKFYIQHLVFSVNIHTQTFIILILFFVSNYFLSPYNIYYQYYLLLVIPAYMYLGMKKFYNQSWRKTFLKFFILTSLYIFVLLAALIAVLVITYGTF